MDDRIRDFIATSARTIVGLDVVLFFQANPSAFDTPRGIALRTHRAVDEVGPALERLAKRGIVERHTRGEGRYTCYALAKDPDIWDLLCMVGEAYLDDPTSRKEIIRLLISIQHEERTTQVQPPATGGDKP